jgi:hypothetical protein
MRVVLPSSSLWWLARTAQTTSETYATDQGGNYKGMTIGELQGYEKTIVGCPCSANARLKTVTVGAEP